MTVFAWDASHNDWHRGPMDLAAARRDGVDMFVHRCAEGHHYDADPYYRPAMGRARAVAMPILGPYFVLHPGPVADQVEYLLSTVEAQVPWWRQHPCWVWRIDAEQFSYLTREPNVEEINAFGDLLCNRAQVSASRVLVYAPRWLYGERLTGLRYRLWASSYGSNPVRHYREAYPGDASTRWSSYGGQSPLLLQYGSQLTVGKQRCCDVSAYRGTLADLIATLGGTMSAWDELLTDCQGRQYKAADWLTEISRAASQQILPAVTAVSDRLSRLEAMLDGAGSPARYPTQDQVNVAVLAAMKDPDVLAGIAAAIAARLPVDRPAHAPKTPQPRSENRG
ncbi:MAG TPA: GH25 family lysozyme [Micromonosporaceae bacterium]